MKITMLILLLSASAAATEPPHLDLSSTLAVISVNTLDAWGSKRFVERGTQCVEGNPRLGPHPSASALALNSALNTAVSLGLQQLVIHIGRKARPEEHRFIQNLNRTVGYVSTAWVGKSVVHNLVHCGW